MATKNIEEGIKPPKDQKCEDHKPITRPTTNLTRKKDMNWALLVLNCTLLSIGVIGGPLLLRLYYIHGGQRKWLISFFQNNGFPILILPLFILFLRFRAEGGSTSSFFLEPKLFFSSAFLGIILGLQNFLYTLGLSYIPISTSSLLFSTQLVFIAIFAWLIVKQKFTAFSINSVVLMTLGSVLLGIHTQGDRPVGVSNGQYLLGFFLTLISAFLIGFIFPVSELSYSKATRAISYRTVLQFQFNLAIFATLFCTIGMLVNKDFQALAREAKEFELGSRMYYTVLATTAVVWQFSFIGGLGLVFYTSSLLTGIVSAVLLPFTEVAAIFIYHEPFNAEKGMALALCLWGFTSYFYGEYKNNKINKEPLVKPDDPCTV